MSSFKKGPDTPPRASMPATDPDAQYTEALERQVAWAHRALLVLAIGVIVASLVFG